MLYFTFLVLVVLRLTHLQVLIPSVKYPHIPTCDLSELLPLPAPWPVAVISSSLRLIGWSPHSSQNLPVKQKSPYPLMYSNSSGSFLPRPVNTVVLSEVPRHCSLCYYCKMETQCEKHWRLTQVVLINCGHVFYLSLHVRSVFISEVGYTVLV